MPGEDSWEGKCEGEVQKGERVSQKKVKWGLDENMGIISNETGRTAEKLKRKGQKLKSPGGALPDAVGWL